MSFWNASWFRVVLKVTTSLVIIATGGITFYVFGQKPEIEKKSTSNLLAGVLVQTVRLQEYQEPIVLKLDGEATTFRVVEIGAEVSGRIEFKSDNCRSGHFVKKGELLFKIDDQVFEIAVESQTAQLEQIDEEIRSLNVDLDNLSTLVILAEEDLVLQRNNLARTQELYDDQATSDVDLDNAKIQELASRNAIQRLKNELSSKQQSKATAQARLKVATVALKRAQLDLDRCSVVASIDGRIVDDTVEQGNFISAGQALTKISDASRMEVRCQLQTSELAWVWEQQLIKLSAESPERRAERNDPIELSPVACEVVYEFGGVETTWDGILTRFAGTGLSRETRTFPARVIVPEPRKNRSQSISASPISVTPPTLVSGMFVEIRIPINLQVPLLSVPVEAVRPGGKLWIAKAGKLKILQVTIARVTGDLALIRPSAALSSGDQVIITPIVAVLDGMPIREVAIPNVVAPVSNDLAEVQR